MTTIGRGSGVQNAEEVVDLALHGTVPQAGQQEHELLERERAASSEVFRVGSIFINKSVVIEGGFN
jgi:hypothetical protein